MSIDGSKIGPVAYEIEIPDAEICANVVALLHPSLAPFNQRHRKTAFPTAEKPEVEMIILPI